MEFASKRVLVTGGSSGIGLAIATALADRGATVRITGRDPAKLDRVIAGDSRLTGAVCDVTDDGQITALRDAIVAEGGVDILINNAGVMAFFNILDGHPIEEQIKEIDIDILGPLKMIHHILPTMLDRETVIVNVSSGLAYAPYAATPVYSGAKAFLHAYTRCLRAQLAATPVRVVELLPPVVDTPLASGLDASYPRMAPEKLALALLRGLGRGQNEIAPGISRPLKWMARLMPGITFWLMNRKVNK